MNDQLKAYRLELNQHPLFKQLLAEVEKPKLKPYRASEADQVEKARAQWIYESGQLKQHDAWLVVLTGTDPSDIGEKT